MAALLLFFLSTELLHKQGGAAVTQRKQKNIHTQPWPRPTLVICTEE